MGAGNTGHREREDFTMKTYYVDGLKVLAESDRHAVKYYRCVIGRDPEFVRHGRKDREVYQTCENTGLAIFCDDSQQVYAFDDSGVHWLKPKEQARMKALIA